MNESFAELFESSQIENKMNQGEVISAMVLDVRSDVIVVNAGLKSEGIIPIEQFYDEYGELEVSTGDCIDVVLDSFEDGYGKTRLSREKAKHKIAWKNLKEAFENNETVRGTITERIKGGFAVNVQNIRAFLPGSQIDIRPVRDYSYLEGKVAQFKVIKVDQERKNVVVSRRAVLSDNNLNRKQLLEQLQEGSIVSGFVKNLTDYGAFVDLGVIDGLLHITDMAWKRIKHPSEVVKIGDEVEVKLLKFERDKNRVSLGLKQITEDPWRGLVGSYPKGKRCRGVVTNMTEYGCFVELEEGVEGLVHVSEMDWTNKNIHPSKIVYVGEEVDVVILDVDLEKHRISLGMKQCSENPWLKFSESYNKNDRIKGKVKSITDFGLFVGLENDIDGLIHLSDISWANNNEETLHNFVKGQELEMMLLGVDAERERISLGLKQLEEDPFEVFIEENPKGQTAKGSITGISKTHATVELARYVEGILRIGEISAEDHIDDINSVMKIGDQVEAKIIAIDTQNRLIDLSLKAKDIEDNDLAIKKYNRENAVQNPKLGDILKEHLDS